MKAGAAVSADRNSLNAASDAVASNRSYIYFLHHFRLAAAILVVASHCYDISWGSHLGAPSSYDFLINLLSGATALFVFISGFFFHYVSSRNFDFDAFLTARIRRLLIPYLAISMGLAITEYLIVAPEGLPLWVFLVRIVSALFMGSAGPAMWFIPFIFIFYILSPVFLKFSREKMETKVVLLFGSLLLGLMINRSADNADKIQNAGYFLFYYLFGILFSTYMDRAIYIIRNNSVIIMSGLAMLALAFAQYRLGMVDNPTGPWFSVTLFNIMYLQKIAQIIFLCGILYRTADRPLPWLTTISGWSLGIFFMHQFGLVLLKPLADNGFVPTGQKYADLLLWTLALTGLSIALIWSIKRLMPGRSHYFIGT